MLSRQYLGMRLEAELGVPDPDRITVDQLGLPVQGCIV